MTLFGMERGMLFSAKNGVTNTIVMSGGGVLDVDGGDLA